MLSERPPGDREVPDVQQVLNARVWEHEGLELRPSAWGLGLFATRPFLAGDVIYEADLLTVHQGIDDLVAQTIVDGEVASVMVTTAHMVVFEDSLWLDVPGCFANHSCEPNTMSIFRDPSGSGHASSYQQVAIVDIRSGDQITCDYTRFDWGDDGLAFDCHCGETGCYGLIDGFGGLPRVIQEQTAGTISMEALRRWTLLREQV